MASQRISILNIFHAVNYWSGSSGINNSQHFTLQLIETNAERWRQGCREARGCHGNKPPAQRKSKRGGGGAKYKKRHKMTQKRQKEAENRQCFTRALSAEWQRVIREWLIRRQMIMSTRKRSSCSPPSNGYWSPLCDVIADSHRRHRSNAIFLAICQMTAANCAPTCRFEFSVSCSCRTFQKKSFSYSWNGENVK